jgi:hypothetical protein
VSATGAAVRSAHECSDSSSGLQDPDAGAPGPGS